MKTISQYWNNLGISRKFSFSFTLLFSLVLLMAATVFFSFLSIRHAEDEIRKSTAIRIEVLKMDRDLEKAHRLLGDFFLHHQRMGLQKAHEQYAQPAIRQIAKVISKSSSLKKKIFTPKLETISHINQTDLNLYLASARRFANTSIEAIELLSKRSSPTRGIEAKLSVLEKELTDELMGFHLLEELLLKAYSFVRKYQINRQGHFMQSALNSLTSLIDAVTLESAIQETHKNNILNLLQSSRDLCHELMDLDQELLGNIQDFTLQKQILLPVSSALIRATEDEVTQIQQGIDKAYLFAAIIIFIIGPIAVLATSCIARLFNKTVTENILQLTQSAHEFGSGNMNSRAGEQGRDELGQLARIFNAMASQVQNLVNNLEKEVELQTAELFESEKRFSNLVNDLPKIAVQGYDRERKVTYWNNTSEALYGYTEEEALGQKFEDLIIPESMQAAVIQAIHNWHESNVSIPASEVVLRHKNGSNIDVFSSHVMLSSSLGEKTMYCIDIDLTDLKLAQSRVQRSEIFYRELFESSTSGVAVYEAIDNGLDFIIRDFNRAAEQTEGLTRKYILGHKVTEIFPSIEEFGLLSVFREVWKTGKPAFHPTSFYSDDNVQGWRENRVYKLPSGEIVSVYNDMSKEKMLEEEKHAVELRLERARKMEAIGLMAGGVAHDLNNILTGITGYPELLLLQIPETSELRQPIEAIKESGKRAAAVVADLLTVARGVAISKVTANMNTLITEYLESPEFSHLRSINRHIQCQTNLAEDLPNFSCSPVHIKKCIMNLVTNAMEAIEGSGCISLKTTNLVPEKQWAEKKGLELLEYIVLTVSDTGSGIPQENIGHIFEPFYTKKVLGRSGTGLGLAVVWNTTEAHGGKIFVKSSEKGTSFQLYFPASDKESIVQSKNDSVVEYIGNNEHILVVDDEPTLRDIAFRMLTTIGYTVDTVASGELAIEYLKNNAVDLLVLDMLMDPGISGYETYEKILALWPDQKAIVASGFSDSDDVKASLKLGACAFIKKPYSLKQLGRAVKRALQR